MDKNWRPEKWAEQRATLEDEYVADNSETAWDDFVESIASAIVVPAYQQGQKELAREILELRDEIKARWEPDQYPAVFVHRIQRLLKAKGLLG